MTFEFATAGRIVFGTGTFAHAGALTRECGCNAFVVTGRSGRFNERLLGALRVAGVSASVFPVGGEPTVADVERGVRAAREAGADCVVALGGGSVIDAGKAIAALVTNDGAANDYL